MQERFGPLFYFRFPLLLWYVIRHTYVYSRGSKCTVCTVKPAAYYVFCAHTLTHTYIALDLDFSFKIHLHLLPSIHNRNLKAIRVCSSGNYCTAKKAHLFLPVPREIKTATAAAYIGINGQYFICSVLLLVYYVHDCSKMAITNNWNWMVLWDLWSFYPSPRITSNKGSGLFLCTTFSLLQFAFITRWFIFFSRLVLWIPFTGKKERSDQ